MADYDERKTYAYQQTAARLKKMPGANICWLCGERIDMALAHPDRMSWSADHITPVAHGGTSTIENLKPAHLGCNGKRGKGDFIKRHPHSRNW